LWDWDKNVCLKCANRWVKTEEGCKPVSDHCADYDSWGHCTKCYKGYEVEKGVCKRSSKYDKDPEDEGCSKWDWDNQVCLECS
jgi:hypothetical protein